MIRLFAMVCSGPEGRRHGWCATLAALRHGNACPFCGERSEVKT